MSDMPERIWARGNGKTGTWDLNLMDLTPLHPQTSYIRADIDQAKLDAANKRIAMLESLAIDCGSSLAAAVSLLERGGKKAAASNKMFEQMLVDYNASLDRMRAAMKAKP